MKNPKTKTLNYKVESPEIAFLKSIADGMSNYYKAMHSMAIKRGIQAAKVRNKNENSK